MIVCRYLVVKEVTTHGIRKRWFRVPAGIPLIGLVLLGLGVTARRLGAGRAKRRTTSHPVSPVDTEAGGSGQKSQRRYVPKARAPPVPTGTARSVAYGPADDAVVVVAPRSASLAGLSRERPPLAGGRVTRNAASEHMPPPEAPTAGHMFKEVTSASKRVSTSASVLPKSGWSGRRESRSGLSRSMTHSS